MRDHEGVLRYSVLFAALWFLTGGANSHVYGGVYGNGYQQGTGKIEVFQVGTSGDLKPERIISGPRTLISSPVDFAWDATGKLYVIDPGFFNSSGRFAPQRVLVFARDARGDASPERIIAGSNTTFDGFGSSIAVDSGGYVYVAQIQDCAIPIFSPGANGNVAPVSFITLSCSEGPSSLAFDNVGNLYAAGYSYNDVDEFSPGSEGWLLDRTLKVDIVAAAISVGHARMYVSQGQFPHGVVQEYRLSDFSPQLTLSLGTPRFVMPSSGVSVDDGGTVYVGAQGHRGKPSAIALFARGASLPTAFIEGSKTGFGSVAGVRVGP